MISVIMYPPKKKNGKKKSTREKEWHAKVEDCINQRINFKEKIREKKNKKKHQLYFCRNRPSTILVKFQWAKKAAALLKCICIYFYQMDEQFRMEVIQIAIFLCLLFDYTNLFFLSFFLLFVSCVYVIYKHYLNLGIPGVG